MKGGRTQGCPRDYLQIPLDSCFRLSPPFRLRVGELGPKIRTFHTLYLILSQLSGAVEYTAAGFCFQLSELGDLEQVPLSLCASVCSQVKQR